MRTSRTAAIFVLQASLSLAFSPVGRTAHQPDRPSASESLYPLLIAAYHGGAPLETSSDDDRAGGIKEEIPSKYAARYGRWKTEFLSTESGRKQWDLYQNNSHLTLTIMISRENAEGATTGNYKWNDAGQLVAATIALGCHLDAGYPNAIYYPVMNSLVPTETSYKIDANTLAATKLAHEFGHVNRTARVDAALYQLQAQLIPQYNKILLSNGRNANDPRLVELARQMGGAPVEIWEDREYWGEANAMIYLRDRFTEENLRCPLFGRIRRSVDLYAKSYETRFQEIAQSTPSRRICGWQ